MKDFKIIYNCEGYDPFIDFLKAYAILCVVIGHALPLVLYDYTLFPLYGGMQVPFFILIQTFHAYKKGKKPQVDINKLWERILMPFLIVQLLIVFVYVVLNKIIGAEPISSILYNVLIAGGKGPGAYYPWIYLQIAILLPLFWKMFQKFPMKHLVIPFILLCFGLDVFFSVIQMSEWIYRLTAFRYIFLLYLGMLWVKSGISYNMVTIQISIVSIMATLFFFYTSYNLEPFFFNTDWKTHRWICYFYVSNLLCVFLWYVYKQIRNMKRIANVIIVIAKSSYEIFLVQMAVFVFIPPIVNLIFKDTYFRIVVAFPLEIGLSLLIGVYIHQKGLLVFPLHKRSRLV